MKKLSVLLLLTFLCFSLHAKILDKVLAAFDDQIITLSQVERVQQNYGPRQGISPQIYPTANPSQKDLVELLLRQKLISSKLQEMGYQVTDDRVEDQIKDTEKRNNLRRSDLLGFLQSKGVTFPEYFEIIRATIEFNIFRSAVIVPLITVTEQQIKNNFYQKNLSDNTLAFKYNLVDFSIDQSQVPAQDMNKLPQILKTFQETGVLPDHLKELNPYELGDMTEEGLDHALIELLKKTDEGAFSNPIVLNGKVHVFFVRKKDLVESNQFVKSKEQIRFEIMEQEATKMMEIWFQRESPKHYIKILTNS